LQQYVGDLPPPSNGTTSPGSVDDSGSNDTQPLLRRRRSWRNRDSPTTDGATASKNDRWVRLMKNVLWKNIRRRNTEPRFQTRRSSSSSSSSSNKRGSFTRRKRDVSSRRRHSRETGTETEVQNYTDYEDTEHADEDYVNAELLNDPVNEFIRSYMIAVSKYWPMFEAANVQMQHVFQSVLTRTTLATNLNRTTLTSAGVPFKEFVVTCR